MSADDLDAGEFVRAAADQKRRVRMRHFEARRSESPLRLVAGDFVGADPIVAGVAAGHVAAAAVDRVAANRLADERGAVGFPIAEIARFQIKVERIAAGARHRHAADRVSEFRRTRVEHSLLRAALDCPPGRFVRNLGALDEYERAFLIADDDVGKLVAIRIAGDDLRAHARIVVDQLRNESHFAALADRLEPIQDRGIERAGIVLAMGPEAFAGDDVLDAVAVDVGEHRACNCEKAMP